MNNGKSSWLGLIGAGCFGAALVMAAGADKPAAPTGPKYAVQVWGPLLHITDNHSNTLYIYQNETKSSRLLSVVNLNETGKPELVGRKAEPEK